MHRRQFLLSGLTLATAGLAIPAHAYPDHPIKLIVPFSPGGATDVVGRLCGERMKSKFGTVVVENKGGGGGLIGATEVARAKPDGETFLFGGAAAAMIGVIIAFTTWSRARIRSRYPR